MVELFQGQPKAAEKRLREVRTQWQSLQQKSLAEETQAYLTDDQAKKYSGEIYEQMTLGVMLTLCSLMTDGVDAESYTLQTFQQQQELLAKLNTDREEPLEAAFGIPAAVPYFRGVLREATLHDHDDALRLVDGQDGIGHAAQHRRAEDDPRQRLGDLHPLRAQRRRHRRRRGFGFGDGMRRRLV